MSWIIAPISPPVAANYARLKEQKFVPGSKDIVVREYNDYDAYLQAHQKYVHEMGLLKEYLHAQKVESRAQEKLVMKPYMTASKPTPGVPYSKKYGQDSATISFEERKPQAAPPVDKRSPVAKAKKALKREKRLNRVATLHAVTKAVTDVRSDSAETAANKIVAKVKAKVNASQVVKSNAKQVGQINGEQPLRKIAGASYAAAAKRATVLRKADPSLDVQIGPHDSRDATELKLGSVFLGERKAGDIGLVSVPGNHHQVPGFTARKRVEQVSGVSSVPHYVNL